MLLPFLTEQYDCDIYAGDGFGSFPPATPSRRVRSFRFEQFPDRAPDYDAILYLVDLEEPEAVVTEYMRQYPGIVLVDDEKPGPLALPLPAEQGTFIVHRAETARLLRQSGCSSVTRLRKPIKLPVMVSAIMDRDFTFASCGRMEPGDGLMTALECIRQLVDGGRDDVRLWAAGECDPDYRERLLAHAR
jgi:hypothetical protein